MQDWRVVAGTEDCGSGCWMGQASRPDAASAPRPLSVSVPEQVPLFGEWHASD